MKKLDLKTLALMGIAGGALISAQAYADTSAKVEGETTIAGHSSSKNHSHKHSCSVSNNNPTGHHGCGGSRPHEVQVQDDTQPTAPATTTPAPATTPAQPVKKGNGCSSSGHGCGGKLLAASCGGPNGCHGTGNTPAPTPVVAPTDAEKAKAEKAKKDAADLQMQQKRANLQNTAPQASK